jgi:hypothetical protein
MKIYLIYEYINKWENLRDIFIFINFSVGLVVFFILIVNEYYCSVDIGLYYMFSLIFSGIREYKIVTYNENNIHSVKYIDFILEFVLEIIFSIWGTNSLYQTCLQKHLFIYIYGIFSLFLHYFMSIIYIMKWRIYIKKICRICYCNIFCCNKNKNNNEVLNNNVDDDLINNDFSFLEENNDFVNDENKSIDSLVYSSDSEIYL